MICGIRCIVWIILPHNLIQFSHFENLNGIFWICHYVVLLYQSTSDYSSWEAWENWLDKCCPCRQFLCEWEHGVAVGRLWACCEVGNSRAEEEVSQLVKCVLFLWNILVSFKANPRWKTALMQMVSPQNNLWNAKLPCPRGVKQAGPWNGVWRLVTRLCNVSILKTVVLWCLSYVVFDLMHTCCWLWSTVELQLIISAWTFKGCMEFHICRKLF